MKKILSLFSIMSLTASPIFLSSQVISCNGTWSLAFKDILRKDIESLTDLSYYNIARECVEVKDSECSTTENGQIMSTLSLSINEAIVTNNEGMLKKITDASLELFKEASAYFDKLVPKFDKNNEDGNAYYYYVIDDKGEYGSASTEISYDSEKNLLEYFGDEIIKPEFQVNTARFAVLKNNLEYTKAFYKNNLSILNETDEYMKNVDYMNKYIENGWFVPMFKIVNKGKAKSHGPTLTKIKFDQRLVDYISVGQLGQEDIRQYEGYWFKENNLINDPNSGIITFEDTDKISSTKKLRTISAIEVSAKMNNEQVTRIYNYGFKDISGGNV
ncbi:hypothetical protein [Spiroplasma floricola]|uniref:Uncharacterized protein n=1 Tax=Spiroplasma floricola 23-6 TaxID=1336749 RepID=A0A2K8SCX6_9MOLU|nr:hypothetical protein [Spiroplasma floricola]AUB31309.1 hypothetical protein SFLOR_v1c02480 [Spiroplasma floricola 23-6]